MGALGTLSTPRVVLSTPMKSTPGAVTREEHAAQT